MRDPNIIRNFHDLEEELNMAPDGVEPIFAISNPLEQRLLEVAMDHGVIDEMISEDIEGDM